MSVRIAPIVEGHGECEAVPMLIRRIAHDIDPGFVPVVLPPQRVPVTKLRKEGELERSVELAARKLQGMGGIVVLVDCDGKDACPAREGPVLLKRAQQARGDVPISVILAKKEYEAWFLASAESLQGKRTLANDLTRSPTPEEIRDAKGWLTARMPLGISYAETTDQAVMTVLFDMTAARRRADSFDKCYREIDSMLRKLRP